MAIRSKLSDVNRAIALALAFVWLGAGVVGIVFGLINDLVLLVGLALFAISYAALWFRVVTRTRLLTWRERSVPWRDQ
jgi:hypothetical protein